MPEDSTALETTESGGIGDVCYLWAKFAAHELTSLGLSTIADYKALWRLCLIPHLGDRLFNASSPLRICKKSRRSVEDVNGHALPPLGIRLVSAEGELSAD